MASDLGKFKKTYDEKKNKAEQTVNERFHKVHTVGNIKKSLRSNEKYKGFRDEVTQKLTTMKYKAALEVWKESSGRTFTPDLSKAFDIALKRKIEKETNLPTDDKDDGKDEDKDDGKDEDKDDGKNDGKD